MKSGMEIREKESQKRQSRDWEENQAPKRLMTCANGVLAPVETEKESASKRLARLTVEQENAARA